MSEAETIDALARMMRNEAYPEFVYAPPPEWSLRAARRILAWLAEDGYVRLTPERLAAAIADHDDICSRMAVPECAPAILAALDAQEDDSDGMADAEYEPSWHPEVEP